MTRAIKKIEDQAADGSSFDSISLNALGGFMLYGPIDTDLAKDACEFILKSNILSNDSSSLTMFVNSEGGYTTDGFSIIDTMETSRLPIQTVGIGQIASMALLVLAAGTKGSRIITPNTEIMAHQYHGGVEGKFHELMAVSKEFLRLKEMFITHFLRHSTMTKKQVEDILFAKSDRWLTPKECKKYGLVDVISDRIDLRLPKKKSA